MTLLQFRRNAAVADPRIIDMILAKGEMEFEETLQQWKQRGHLLNLLNPELPEPDVLIDAEEFFRRFLNGTLTSKDVWKDWDRAEQARVLQAVAADTESSSRVTPEDLAKWSKKWSRDSSLHRRGGSAPV